jgi:hypothetical protein
MANRNAIRIGPVTTDGRLTSSDRAGGAGASWARAGAQHWPLSEQQAHDQLGGAGEASAMRQSNAAVRNTITAASAKPAWPRRCGRERAPCAADDRARQMA